MDESLFLVDQSNPCPVGLGPRKSSSAAAAAAVFSSFTIEMIELDQSSKAYTSIKNLLRTTSMLSPLCCSSSWEDIPLKDPLVKQAAWAYLQPMASTAGEDCGGGGFFGIFRRGMDNRSPVECGCLAWLNEIVVKGFLELLSGKKRIECLPDDDEEENENENFAGRGDYDDGEKAD